MKERRTEHCKRMNKEKMKERSNERKTTKERKKRLIVNNWERKKEIQSQEVMEEKRQFDEKGRNNIKSRRKKGKEQS